MYILYIEKRRLLGKMACGQVLNKIRVKRVSWSGKLGFRFGLVNYVLGPQRLDMVDWVG